MGDEWVIFGQGNTDERRVIDQERIGSKSGRNWASAYNKNFAAKGISVKKSLLPISGSS